MSGRLFLSYVLDAQVGVEGNRLRFLSDNQSKIKADKYGNLLDFVATREEQRYNRQGIQKLLKLFCL